MNNICVFCLSKDRKIYFLSEEQWCTVNVFLDVEFEVNIKYLNSENQLKICWECCAKINNISSFIKLAKKTCSYLTQYMKQTAPDYENLAPSISKLSTTEVEIINVLSFKNEETSTLYCNTSTKQEHSDLVIFPNFIKVEEKEFHTEPLNKNASSGNIKLEDNWVKIDAITDRIEEDRTLDSSSDSDNEPLANRVSQASKNKIETKMSQSTKHLVKNAKSTKRKTAIHPPKCTVSWASNSQAQEWYQEERRTERLANPSCTLRCDACDRSFADIEALNLHVQESHNEEAGQFNCNLCLYRFTDVTHMKQHVENHYIQYKCNECSYITRKLTLMQIHTKETHPIENSNLNEDTKKKTVKCRRCKNNFPSGEIIKKHRKECQLYKCDECEMSFTNLSAYKKHKNNHKNATAEAYTYCEGCKSYIKNTWYKKHFLTSLKHVSRDTFKFPCSVCSVKMPTSYTLKLHMFKVHLKRGVHQCELCPSYYMNRRRLDRHRATNHQLGTFELKRDKICELCGKGFTSNHLLDDHRRTHTGEKPHRCQFCPASFVQHGSLYRHNVLVHQKRIAKTGNADADKVCCDACGKEFATKFLLKIHYDYYHLKKTKHRCEICDKYFISTVTLRSHNQHHHCLVTNKSYPCSSCDKIFKSAPSLSQHLKTNCGSTDKQLSLNPDEKQYKCRSCGDTFRRSSTLYMHYKMKHLKLKRNDRVAIKNLYNLDKEIVVIRDPIKL